MWPMIIAAGASLANGLMQKKGNEKAQQHDENLAWQQNVYNRANAREQNQYNLEMWHKQNQYAHPSAQMARLAEAGLSPHLIYGSSPGGASGVSGSPANAADVKGYSRAQSRNIMEGVDVFGDFYRFKNIHAQTDNVQAQTDLAEAEKVRKYVETLVSAQKLKSDELSYDISSELKETTLEAARVALEVQKNHARKSGIEADIAAKTQDEQEKIVEEKLKQILKQNKGEDLKNRILELERDLNENGIQKSDAMIWRVLGRIAKSFNVNLNSIF